MPRMGADNPEAEPGGERGVHQAEANLIEPGLVFTALICAYLRNLRLLSTALISVYLEHFK
jgi:hypothetical protein